MEERDKEIAKRLRLYAEMYPNRVSDKQLALYARMLIDYSPKEIEAALYKLVKETDFFPTIAQISKTVEGLREFVREAGGKGKPLASEAWQEAQRLAHDCFLYRPWRFSCQEVEQAVKQFGKEELCMLTPDGMNTARAQFMRIYQGISQKNEDRKRNVDALRQAGAKLPPAVMEKIKMIGGTGRI